MNMMSGSSQMQNRRLELWLASLELEAEIWMRELMQKLEGQNVSTTQPIPGAGKRQGFDRAGGADENQLPNPEEPEPVRNLY